jgi:hypothetical protein
MVFLLLGLKYKIPSSHNFKALSQNQRLAWIETEIEFAPGKKIPQALLLARGNL